MSTEFELHRRRRRDERCRENFQLHVKPLKSYLTFALIAHTTTRDDVIDALR